MTLAGAAVAKNLRSAVAFEALVGAVILSYELQSLREQLLYRVCQFAALPARMEKRPTTQTHL